jgi:subtilisin family serine protease
MTMRRAFAIVIVAMANVALLLPMAEGGAFAQTRIAPTRIAPPSAPTPQRMAPQPNMAPRVVVPRPVVPRDIVPRIFTPDMDASGARELPPPSQQRSSSRPSTRARSAPPIRARIPPPRPGSFAAPEPISAGSFDPDAFVEAELLMTMRAGLMRSDADAIAGQNGLTISEAEPIGLIDTLVLRLAINDGRSLEEVIAALENDPRVVYVGRNRIFRSQGQSKAASPQYAITRLNVRAAHELATGRGVTIAVIDTAADLDHPALAKAVIRSKTLREDAMPSDHATQIIGLIVAGGLLLGAAPAAEILSLPAFLQEAGGHGSYSTTMILLRALDLSDRDGARVVNMSFAGGEDRLLTEALDAMDRRGRVMVAAAGNGGPGAAPAFPASHHAVIAVTAVDASDGLYAMANRGAYVTLAAPGVDVLAPAARGAYSLATGTSHATAYVSAAAALMLETSPEATAEKIRSALIATAIDLGPSGHDPQFGSGRVAPLAAIREIEDVSRTDAPGDGHPIVEAR